MSLYYNFQLPTTSQTFTKVRINTTKPLKVIKEIIIDAFLKIDELNEEILAQLTNYLEIFSTQCQQTDKDQTEKQKKIIEDLKQKFQKMCRQRQEEQEEQGIVENEAEFSAEENDFFNKAFVFQHNSKELSFDDEEYSISQLGIQKQETISIKFDIMRGFSVQETSTPSGVPITVQFNPFLLCKNHKNQTFSHYCKKCKKLICVFEFNPQTPDSIPSCMGHEIITLGIYETELKNQMPQYVAEIKNCESEITQQNVIMDAKSDEINKKKGKNNQQMKMLEEMRQNIENLLSDSYVVTRQYEKLELLIKINEEFINNKKILLSEVESFGKEELLEKNKLLDHSQTLEKEIITQKDEITKKNSDIERLSAELQTVMKQNEELIKEKDKLKQEVALLESKQVNDETKSSQSSQQKKFLSQMDSTILDSHSDKLNLLEKLKSFVATSLKTPVTSVNFKLLYRGSRDGFQAKKFHEYCDISLNDEKRDDSRTLVLVKSSNSSIFGGFTSKSWGGNRGFMSDDRAFLFSLYSAAQPDRKPTKMLPKTNEKAIQCQSDYGPQFGGIWDMCNTKNSYSDLNHTYDAGFPHNTEKATTFFCGSKWFTVSEIEVFIVKNPQ